MRKTIFPNNSGRGRSSGLWGTAGGCPWDEQGLDTNLGWKFTDDFDNGSAPFPVPTITTAVPIWKYQVFGEATTTTFADAAEVGGAITFGHSADNKSCAFAQLGQPFRLSRATGKQWFECKVKVSTIGTNTHNTFIGLMDAQTLISALPMTATAGGTTNPAAQMADINCVGFLRCESLPAQWSFIYKANGVTAVTTVLNLGAAVAATYIKLGWVYDPSAQGLFKITPYVNGVASSTSKILPLDTAAGTDFPNDINMGLVAGQQGAAGTLGTSTLDWWDCFQLAV